ncbi:MAG: DUF4037 domain-containing protein [Candidatus Omnitrophica bacterium]|nr:DUF4037 domain-containing protein [Candidatus Omnitrophota bacterium]
MPTGIEISRDFYAQIVKPILAQKYPEELNRAAVGVFGTGSDTVGLDDELSRDHHWGPRVNILMADEDYNRVGDEFLSFMKDALPPDFECFPIGFPKLTRGGVSVESIGHYFRCFAKMETPPLTDLDWLRTTEADLFHLTHGVVFEDASGEFTARREAFSYYPDTVWKKKIADWCLYFTGSTSPYNVNRCSRREDFVSAEIFFGAAVKRAMELCFLLNRSYAPYTKWLSRLLPDLPKLGKEVMPIIDRAIASRDWHERVMCLIEIAHIYAKEMHRMGLTSEPHLQEFDPTFADLTLYESALQLYKELPEELLHAKFNEEEYWEYLAREVLFDTDDYFQKRLQKS